MALPFRNPVSEDDEEQWQPPSYAEPVAEKWTPPDYAEPVEKKEEKKSIFSAPIKAVKDFLTPAEKIHPGKESPKQNTKPLELSDEEWARYKPQYDPSKPIGSQTPNESFIQTFAREHPYAATLARRIISGPSKEELGGRELVGAGDTKMPGAETLRQKGLASGSYWKGAASSIGADILDLIAQGFDPRASGLKEPELKAAEALSQRVSPREIPKVSELVADERPLPTRSPNLAEPPIETPTKPIVKSTEDELYDRAREKFNMGKDWTPPDYAEPITKKEEPFKSPFEKKEQSVIKSEEKPTAQFMYEDPNTGKKMFNIQGGPSDKSTVSEDTLNKMGIDVPDVSDEQLAETKGLTGAQLRERALAKQKPQETVKLYRGESESSTPGPNAGRYFTDRPDVALYYAKADGRKGRIYSIEVPKDEAAGYRDTTSPEEGTHLLPQELADKARQNQLGKSQEPIIKPEESQRAVEAPQSVIKPEEPKAPSISEKLTAKAQDFEDKALARIKARGTFSGSRLTAGIPADDLADLAIVGAARIAKGAIRFSDWSVGMIKDFGEAIRPHLEKIFKAAQEKHMELSPDDPINKLSKGLDTAKPLEAEQASIYSKERGLRAGAVSQVKTLGEQGYYEQLGKLKGEHTKVEFTPLRNSLKQPEIDHLFNTITQSPEQEFTKINAKDGLTKMLNGQVPQANQIDTLERVFGREFPNLRKIGNRGEDFLTKLANFSSKTTRAVLGFHVPGTAISFHGFNEAIRNTIFGTSFNPVSAAKRFGEAAYYLTNPKAAGRFLDVNAEALGRAMSDGGLKVATTDIGLSPLFKGENFLSKGFNALTNPEPLFGQVIPSLKLKAYTGLLNQYQRAGIPYAKAAKMSGLATNNIFGGLNLKMLQRNPTTQKLFRAAALAPDWLESNARLGKGMFEAIKNPSSPAGRVYQIGIANFLGSYIGLNILNAINNDGKFSYQNEVGHEFDVAFGKDSAGRVRYLSPYGTAMDMVRIPLEIAHAAVEGNMGRVFQDVRSRASELAQFSTDLMTNTDYAGRALYDKTKYNKPIPPLQQGENIASDAAGHFLPVGIEAGANLMRGKISSEEFAAQFTQLPLKYKFPQRR